jgi:DNA modification methylase
VTLMRETDALEGIMQVNEPIDLLCTDPPYAFGGSGEEHEISATVAVTLREAATRMRTGAHAVVFCASSWRSIQYMVDAVRGVLVPVRTGRWVKPSARTRVKTVGWSWASVEVLLFRKGRKSSEGGAFVGLDWIEHEPLWNGRRAQLPPAVAEWAVQPFVTSGGLAVDPFAGSGALLHAAEKFGMRTLGFERQAA